MDSEKDWQGEYQRELTTAKNAHNQGNEGMARVCARRAANVIVGEYLRRHGHSELSRSVADRIALLTSHPEVDNHSKVIASHFLLRVTPEHRLPVEVDLIGEVERLMNKLLLENIE
jgi:hypothetical protein